MDYNGGSLKSQMRKADKLNSAQVVIIGEIESELTREEKNMPKSPLTGKSVLATLREFPVKL